MLVARSTIEIIRLGERSTGACRIARIRQKDIARLGAHALGLCPYLPSPQRTECSSAGAPEMIMSVSIFLAPTDRRAHQYRDLPRLQVSGCDLFDCGTQASGAARSTPYLMLR